MRGIVRLGLASAILVTACGIGGPAIGEGWDPDGNNQLVTYGRNRGNGASVGVKVSSADGTSSWGRQLGTGCQAVAYPWSISVGPADDDPSLYEEVLNSGSVTQGTSVVWMDIAPDGAVTVGWGKPDWAAGMRPSKNCGERP